MNLDKIYREGELYYSQKGTYKNPYPNGSMEFNEFERGWTQALKRTNGSCISASTMGTVFSEKAFNNTSAYEDKKLQSELYRSRKG